MKGRHRIFRMVGLAFLIFFVGVLGVAVWFFRPWIYGIGPYARITSITPGQDLRGRSLRSADLRHEADTLPTVRYNLETRWPVADQLPPGASPAQQLTNAMNPGLGVRELHRQGITGVGVHVAIIDYSIEGRHPEYARQIVEIYRVAGAHSPTMHGPAVTSLLVGQNCGTAPGALLHFVAIPDATSDAAHVAEGLDWIRERNRSLSPEDRIKLVSISSAPSGRALFRFRNGELYDAAVQRAEASGILVIDGTEHHAFVGPCSLDPENRESPERCRAVTARGHTNYYASRILAPASPRTTAEEYYIDRYGYQYCGISKETFLSAGSSWSMPYCAGVIALGLQLRPDRTAREMKELLFTSAYVRPDGTKIIFPQAFIKTVKALPQRDGRSAPEPRPAQT